MSQQGHFEFDAPSTSEGSGWPAFFSDFDRRFADTLSRFEAQPSVEVQWAAALASAMNATGRVCVGLDEFAGRPWPVADGGAGDRGATVLAPNLGEWVDVLRQSAVVGHPGEFKPLILDEAGRLYLQRYWQYEDDLARRLMARAALHLGDVTPEGVAESLEKIAQRGMVLAPGQAQAVATALLRPLSVIAGGAGTGKTTIVACILRLLAEHVGGPGVRVRVAAPTGKAANRLGEQLKAARAQVDPDGRIEEILDDEPATIHRLLGGSADGVHFRFHAANPLPLHALIVDESSMVDIALMTKLVRALPPRARLVLVGDPEQLPPVEVGSVFGELVRGGRRFSAEGAAALSMATGQDIAEGGEAPLEDAVVLLEESFRFASDSGIGKLANALREGDVDSSLALLEEGRPDLRGLSEAGAANPGVLEEIARGYSPLLEAIRQRLPPREVLARMARFRVLAVRREGDDGVVGLNATIERHLRDHRGLRVSGSWYPGRMVMVTRNNHTLRLFNGDVGVALPGEGGRLEVFFDTGGEPRGIAPGRLSHVETVFAMTVHKSQGSEYESACLVLPQHGSRLLSRELLYTAATRARSTLFIAGPRARFREALANPLPRTSALADTLETVQESAPPERG